MLNKFILKDLWGGNYSADEDGNPILFDPAAYFGHNEAELGMMVFNLSFPILNFIYYFFIIICPSVLLSLVLLNHFSEIVWISPF